MNRYVTMICWLVLFTPLSAAAQERLPIYACVSIPGGVWSTPERYQQLADAGFTTSLTGFDSMAEAVAAMDMAQAAGVSVWVLCPEVVYDPAAAVAGLRDHPAFAGYHISDEPSAAAFDALGERVRTFQALDPDHPCYINLLPIYASSGLGTATYQEYIDQFLAKVPVPMLSFDHYPTWEGTLDQGVYTNLEIVRDAARGAGIPFWTFYQSVQWDTHPVRTLAQLRLECYSSLAYGSQCVQAYDYWQTFSDDFASPIGRDGTPSYMYSLVQTVNREVQDWSRVFLGTHVTEVAHLGRPLPTGSRAYAVHAPLATLDAGSGSAVVATLRTGDREFLVLVNKSLTDALNLTLTFAVPQDVLEVGQDGTDRPLSGSTFRIEPGSLLVFQAWSLAGQFGRREGDAGWNPASDLNGDLRTDATDLALMLGHQAP